MANLTESPIYESGIFQLEKSTPAVGGAPVIDAGIPSAGHANAQAQQLANRTNNLNQRLTTAEGDIDTLQAQVAAGGSAASLAADLANNTDPTKGATLSGVDGTTVAAQILLSRKLSDYTALRAYTGPANNFRLTTSWLSGDFIELFGTSGIVDDGGVFIVGGTGRVFQRANSYPLQAKWWGLGSGSVTNTTALNNACLAASNLGGGVLDIGSGSFSLTAGITSYSNIVLRGAGMKATTISIAAVAGTTIAIDILLAAGSFNSGGVIGITLNNSAAAIVGLAAIKTPQDIAGFDNAQKWCFGEIGFQGGGWTTYMDIGDASQGYITNCEWRGKYLATATDTGQAVCSAIKLSGLKGNVSMRITGFRGIGVRTFLELGENTEGFYVNDGEATNCWYGIYANPVASKPGGFIGPIHISANKGCIEMHNRRDMNIGMVQCYRSTGMFDHGTEWVGINLDNCQRVEGGKPLVRNFLPSTASQYGISITGCDKVMFDGMLQGEPGGITQSLRVSAVTNSYIGPCGYDGVTTLLSLAGITSNSTFGPFIGPAIPSTPFVFTGSSIDRSTVRILAISTVPDYVETTYAVATDVAWNFRTTPKRVKINVTAAVVVNITIQHLNALKGDPIDLKIVLTGGTGKTINLKNEAGTTLYTLASVAGNTFMNVRILDNGAGVVIDDVHASLA